jgi:hypothetical protein
MRDLWTSAGLEAVETRAMSVQRTFSNFEEFWDVTVSGAPSLRPTLGVMSRAEVEPLKTRVRARSPGDAAGRITYGSRANAVKGRVPAQVYSEGCSLLALSGHTKIRIQCRFRG